MVRRRVAAGYLAIQAAATVAWWLAMAGSDRVREAFELDDRRPEALDAFLFADLVALVAGSAIAAVGVGGGHPWARTAVALTAGGAGYATLYLLGWVAAGGDGWLGIAPMSVATAATIAIAIVGPR